MNQPNNPQSNNLPPLQSPAIPLDKTDQTILLLQQNNQLLSKIHEILHKQARRQIYGAIWHVLTVLIPLILIIYSAWVMYDFFQSNMETIKNFTNNVKDLGSVSGSIKDTLNDLSL